MLITPARLYPLYMAYRARGLCPLFAHWAARRDLIKGKDSSHA